MFPFVKEFKYNIDILNPKEERLYFLACSKCAWIKDPESYQVTEDLIPFIEVCPICGSETFIDSDFFEIR